MAKINNLRELRLWHYRNMLHFHDRFINANTKERINGQSAHYQRQYGVHYEVVQLLNTMVGGTTVEMDKHTQDNNYQKRKAEREAFNERIDS